MITILLHLLSDFKHALTRFFHVTLINLSTLNILHQLETFSTFPSMFFFRTLKVQRKKIIKISSNFFLKRSIKDSPSCQLTHVKRSSLLVIFSEIYMATSKKNMVSMDFLQKECIMFIQLQEKNSICVFYSLLLIIKVGFKF